VLKSLLKRASSIFGARKSLPSSSQASAISYTDIHGNPIENGDNYFYRPKVVGFPVFKSSDILAKHQALIESIKEKSGIGQHREIENRQVLDHLFTDVVTNYINYAHMLPASDNHHHSAPGGLIYHSLEASLIAMREAKKYEGDSTGFIDVDNAMKPINHYSAWLLALVHDAGKIFTDILVYPLRVIDPSTKAQVSASDASVDVPVWQPQKETLIEWARRFGVTHYQVEFLKTREHNKHTTSSAQIIDRVLTPHAKDFILNSPRGRELMADYPRILGSYLESANYIENAVRLGDTLSTSHDKHVSFDIARGELQKAMDARIVDCMMIARRDWTFNSDKAEAWIINKEVFLRWTSAFDSILRVAKRENVTVPPRIQIILSIMRDRNIVEPLGKANTSCKFAPGEFSESRIIKVRQGAEAVKWFELVRLSWSGFAFGSSPLPNSQPGLIYLTDDDVYLSVDREGNVQEFRFNGKDQLVNDQGLPLYPSVEEQQENTEAATSAANDEPSDKKEPVTEKSKAKQEAESQRKKPTKKKSGAKKDKPAKKSAKEILTGKSSEQTPKADIELLMAGATNAKGKAEKAAQGAPKEQLSSKKSEADSGSKPEEKSRKPHAAAQALHELGVLALVCGDGFYVAAEQLTKLKGQKLPAVTTWLTDIRAIKPVLDEQVTHEIEGIRCYALTKRVGEDLVTLSGGEVMTPGNEAPVTDTDNVTPEHQPDAQSSGETGTEHEESQSATSTESVGKSVPQENGEPTPDPELEDNVSDKQREIPSFAQPVPRDTSSSAKDESSSGKQLATNEGDDLGLIHRIAKSREGTLGHFIKVLFESGLEESQIPYDGNRVFIPLEPVLTYLEQAEIRQYRKVTFDRLLSKVGCTLEDYGRDYEIVSEVEEFGISDRTLWILVEHIHSVELLNE